VAESHPAATTDSNSSAVAQHLMLPPQGGRFLSAPNQAELVIG
jgi:hypothetical protein